MTEEITPYVDINKVADYFGKSQSQQFESGCNNGTYPRRALISKSGKSYRFQIRCDVEAALTKRATQQGENEALTQHIMENGMAEQLSLFEGGNSLVSSDLFKQLQEVDDNLDRWFWWWVWPTPN